MTEFEEHYLLCGTVGLAPTDLFFSSGPADLLEPYSSVMVQSIVEYQTTEIADTISRLPHIKLLRQSESETFWRWKRKGHFIEISVDGDNTTEDGVWVASRLTQNCTFADLVEFWLNLRDKHPAIYLHSPSCRMYTPCSFLEEEAVWALSGAFHAGNRAVRTKAMQVFQHYRELHRQPRLWQPYWEKRAPHMTKTLFDLAPPLVPIKCKDFWHRNNWRSRLDQFDKQAHARKLRYFAYPTGEWVEGKYKSGFMVWVSDGQKVTGEEIADSVGVLVTPMSSDPPAKTSHASRKK
jgi:hypothetical protein